ncbi:membrane protein [Arthrobacter phage Cole]|uniref:Membrane protein n=1 Tax=Arthrobacter phage Cole TaxID=2944951 RepID=A0A9E7J7J0_9CAUD|nr:membrane protein [Arthrobacter phage Cole]URC18080.1 membrane protein [Arthrobacter phage Cole]
MSNPTARAGRNRRRAYLFTPLLGVGALAMLTSSPLIFNSADLIGLAFLVAGAAGFVHETGKDND